MTLKQILFIQYLNWFDKDIDKKYMEENLKNFEEFESWNTEEHCGDCTKVPAPCLKCTYDQILKETKIIYDYLEKAKVIYDCLKEIK